MFATHLAQVACGTFVSTVGRWPVESQQRARRNAMIAATALTQLRAERQEVEEFLAALTRNPGAAAPVEAAHG
jgi:hypothetical protein